MSDTLPQPATIAVDAKRSVSALIYAPSTARTCFVFAHGAGADMRHRFMEATSSALCALDVATLRFQFPYMESGSRRPDLPTVCHATVRAAVTEAGRRFPSVPLIAGGRSFGGRMVSQTQAKSPLPGVRGLVFLGFPLHPAGRPSDERAQHLADVAVPLLFLQGDRDELAQLDWLRPLIRRLGVRATLNLIDQADHSFHVPARSGRNDAQVISELVQVIRAWSDGLPQT